MASSIFQNRVGVKIPFDQLDWGHSDLILQSEVIDLFISEFLEKVH